MEKTAACSDTGGSPPLSPIFPQLLWKFQCWVMQVRSPGQNKWPNYTITLQSCHNYNVWGKVINPRPAGGGGGRLNVPPGLSRIAKIRRRRRIFTHLNPHVFRNFGENFGPRSCKVRSPLQVKWPNYKITFQPRHGYNVLGKFMNLSEYDRVISAYKTYISDFLHRWPQVRSFLRSPHYVNRQNIISVICIFAQAYLSGITSYRTVVDNSSKNLHCLPLKRSFEITRGHQLSFANNFWSKRVRDVGLVSVRSSRPDESTDLRYDPFRSPRDLDLTWPEVKLWTWPF